MATRARTSPRLKGRVQESKPLPRNLVNKNADLDARDEFLGQRSSVAASGLRLIHGSHEERLASRTLGGAVWKR